MKTIISSIIYFLKKQKLLSSLLFCTTLFMIFIAISGFNIISGNDDYCVFKLIYFGDVAVPCVGLFFTSFISLIQPLFGNLNSYMIVQEFLCLSSALIINYVFLSTLKGKSALLLTLAFDIIYFSFIPLNILYSYTAIVSCTAGLALLVFASMFESRKCFRIVQEIIAFLMIIIGSQVRFPPFEAIGAVFAAFAAGVVLASFIKNKKHGTVKNAISVTVKKYLKTFVLIVIVAVFAFGADIASTALKHTVKGYDEIDEYYTALSAVNDHDTSSYYYEKEFFKSIGIPSSSGMILLKHWFIDEDFFTVDKLNTISEHSLATSNLGKPSGGILSYITNPIAKAFTNHLRDGSIFIMAFVLIILAFIVVVLCIMKPSLRARAIKVSLCVVLWSFFFVVAGFSIESVLVIPLAVLTLYISLRYDNYKFLVTAVLSLAVIVIYYYMMTYRLYLHVTAAFIIPAFVFMVIGLRGETPLRKVKNKKSFVVPVCIAAAILIGCSIASASVLFLNQVYVSNKESNTALKQYINNNPNYVFLINQTGLSKDYYEPFVLEKEPENTANYGLWVGKSGYIKNTRARNGIKHIFKDSINSNIVIPIFERDDPEKTVGNNFPLEFEEYYNEQYAQKGETIKMKKIDKVGDYSIYKIVSKKNNKK